MQNKLFLLATLLLPQVVVGNGGLRFISKSKNLEQAQGPTKDKSQLGKEDSDFFGRNLQLSLATCGADGAFCSLKNSNCCSGYKCEDAYGASSDDDGICVKITSAPTVPPTPRPTTCGKEGSSCDIDDHYCCAGLDCVGDGQSSFGTCEAPTSAPTPAPTRSPTKPPTPGPTPPPTPRPSKSPTLNPTPVPTPEPTPEPTRPPTPRPTSCSVAGSSCEIGNDYCCSGLNCVDSDGGDPDFGTCENPTPGPTRPPTPGPTRPPTPSPTQPPSPRPTPGPSPNPTPRPSPNPTPRPSPDPTGVPTLPPTPQPTPDPSRSPTPDPTRPPTPSPTACFSDGTSCDVRDDLCCSGLTCVDTDGGNPNFGICQQLGSIAGKVLEDIDNDDDGDEPIEGVEIQLRDGDGNVIATTLTNSEGEYIFEDLVAGDYVVRQNNLPMYSDVADADGGNKNRIDVTIGNGSPFDAVGQDFIDERLQCIEGYVFEDTDNNDIGDDPVNDVVINLENESGSVISTTSTQPDGTFKFCMVPPGEYTLVEEVPDGYVEVTDSDGGNPTEIDVSVGSEDNTGNIFVIERLRCIRGKVLEDTDDDNTGEEDVGGVLITLLDDDGDTIATTRTKTNGKYEFCELPPGDYSVSQTVPDGFVEVTDSDGGNPSLIDVELGNSDSNGNNFVIEGERVCIKGKVEEDTDDDDDGDESVGGVTINLRDDEGDVIDTTTTNGNGRYEFCSLAPGEYSVVEEVPSGYESVTDSDGGNPTVINVDATEGDSTGNDFVIELIRSCIKGKVEEDTDDDDDGDESVSGVVVTLRDSSGDVIATTSTNGNGRYEFCELLPGDYSVRETVPSGYESVTDSDGGNPTSISVSLGETDSAGNDFVIELIRSCIKGKVEEDTDDDDDGDESVSGVVIRLRDSSGDVIATTSTNGNGRYEFCELLPGDYSVRETVPSGYESVTDSDGGNPTSISVSLGETDSTGNDFVIERERCISGFVLEDTDNDGSGEEPVRGVTIKLRDDDGNVVGTTSTRGNGAYEFCNLSPGEYSVVQSTPAGFDEVSDTDGGNPTVINVDVTSGDSSGNNFVIELETYCVRGYVLEDIDEDEQGDDPVRGVVVTLLDSGGVAIATSVTRGGGLYEFCNVIPGEYTVVQTVPPEYKAITDSDGGDPKEIEGIEVVDADKNNNNFVIELRCGEVGTSCQVDSSHCCSDLVCTPKSSGSEDGICRRLTPAPTMKPTCGEGKGKGKGGKGKGGKRNSKDAYSSEDGCEEGKGKGKGGKGKGGKGGKKEKSKEGKGKGGKGKEEKSKEGKGKGGKGKGEKSKGGKGKGGKGKGGSSKDYDDDYSHNDDLYADDYYGGKANSASADSGKGKGKDKGKSKGKGKGKGKRE